MPILTTSDSWPTLRNLHPAKDPQEIKTLANLPVSGALLDAGGGTGRIAQGLADQADQVLVADLSFRMLLQTRGKDSLKPVCTHSERLPFADHTFERVIMVDALHHVCDQRQTVAELRGGCSPGGRLVIDEPDVRNWSIKLVALAEKLALMRSHFLSPPEIACLFQDPRHTCIETRSYNAWIIVEK
jgi:demethylmenaquinone methyltransferase/2-methoxy-6-polyprenyl-1,4-benzoquinol methylase